MANNSKKVFAGKPAVTGGVLVAPRGTKSPTTAVATLTSSGFNPTGYISDAGLSRSESRDFSTTKEWGGLTVKRTQNGFEATFKFAFLEYLNPDGARQIYGDDAVTVLAATTAKGEQMKVSVKGTEPPHKAWLFDMFDGDARVRVYVGDGQITETGDVTYSTEGGVLREVTLTAYPDENGDLFVELTDDGVRLSA